MKRVNHGLSKRNQIVTILDIVQYRSKPTDGFPRPEKNDTKHDTNVVKYFKQPKTSSNEQRFC